MKTPTWGLALACATAAAACDESPARSAPLTRDSAGIAIIENAAPHPADSTAWTVDSSPVAVIGRETGDPPHIFGRIAGFERQDDGTIVVADAEAAEIRFFTPGGEHKSTTGRPGSGPGEYAYFSRIYKLHGDSLLVVDHEGQRRSVLDPQGKFVRTYGALREKASTGRFLPVRHVIDYFPDGSYLLGSERSACVARPFVRIISEGGFCEDTLTVTHATQTGDLVGNYGRMIGSRTEVLVLPEFGIEPIVGRHPPVFLHVHTNRVYYTDSRKYEIRIFDSTGALVRIVRAAHELSPPDKQAPYRNAPPGATQPVKDRTAALNKAYAESPWPEHNPAFGAFVVDAEGNLWVQEHVALASDPAIPVRWTVFDSTGILRYSVRMPSQRRGGPYGSLKIGRDYVMTLGRDSLGVESVAVFPLRKR